MEDGASVARAQQAYPALLDKLESATVALLDVDKALHLPPLPGEDFDKLSTVKKTPTRRVPHVVGRPSKLKDAAEVGM